MFVLHSVTHSVFQGITSTFEDKTTRSGGGRENGIDDVIKRKAAGKWLHNSNNVVQQ